MAIVKAFVLCTVGLVIVGAMEPSKVSLQLKKCEVPTRHYTLLGCKPVFTNEGNACPERFECPLLPRPDDKKCYLRSKTYELGEEVSDLGLGCSSPCICSTLHDGRAGFMCAELDECFLEPGCAPQYEKNDCCPDREICDAKEIAALATCDFQGRVYKEGEIIWDGCSLCSCGKEFNGTLKSLQCYESTCGIETVYSAHLNEKGVPFYIEKDSCCPTSWNWPEKGYNIKQTNETIKSDDPKMKCFYGNETMDVGDELVAKDHWIICRCRIPPILTCIMDNDIYFNRDK